MTTNEALNKIASDEGFRDSTTLMENASLAYIADRCKRAMQLYAQQFIDAANEIIGPASDVLGEAYDEDYENNLTGDWIVDKNSIINAPKQELK